jgi:CrcB protein
VESEPEQEAVLSSVPLDPDLVPEEDDTPAVSPHRRLRYALAVAVGGAVGVAARYLVTTALAPATGQPVVTLLINCAGSFLLGLLLESLALRGPDRGRRRLLRLMVGTGGLGGFTTYSTLAVNVQTFGQAGQPLIMIGYGLGSVLLGILAAAAGIAVGLRLAGRRGGRDREGRA